MQLLGDNTFVCTNGEITLEINSEVFTRQLTDCEMGSFRVDTYFHFLYSGLSSFSDFPHLLKNSCPNSSELMGTER